jgi:hypothetical protein
MTGMRRIKHGNVWYFGENTKAYDSAGNYSTEGTWMAGINEAQPGIVMFGNRRDMSVKRTTRNFFRMSRRIRQK